MNFRITLLCENSVGALSGTLGEHGFAALIEPSGAAPILFDTGQGLTLLHNARRMNKSLSALAAVVLSHGHYDHSGGLLPLFQEIGGRPVFTHPDVFAPRYRVKDTGEAFPIGIPATRRELELLGASFDCSDSFREIIPGIWLTGEVPRLTVCETGDLGLFADAQGIRVDQTPDDQTLVLESERGLVVLLGCCHAGVINTLRHIALKLQRSDFYAVIGGTHLGFCGQEQLTESVAALKRWGVKKVVAGHCTGFAAALRLSREMPQEFQPAMVGYTLQL